MRKVVNIKSNETENLVAHDDAISIKEAALILGLKYGAARNTIFSTDKDGNPYITHYVYGPRNIKVSRQSTLAYKKAHEIKGRF